MFCLLRFCFTALFALCAQLHLSARAASFELPYRQSPLTLDGDNQDWYNSANFDFAETRGKQTERNQVTGRISWDREALWVFAKIDDQELIAAPAKLAPERFHLYDSLQIYLDPLGDSSGQMNADDLNILLLPDGRATALRGDKLLAELYGATVPQRLGAPLQMQYRAKLIATGWQFELRIPFAAIGLPEQAEQNLPPRTMRMDVAMQDWRVDAATIPAGDTLITAAELLSVNWQGAYDFGYPKYWRPVQLLGRPSWRERLLNAIGPTQLVLVFAAILSLLAGISIGYQRRQLTRRLSALQSLMADLQARLAHPEPAQPTLPPSVQEQPGIIARTGDVAKSSTVESRFEPENDVAARALHQDQPDLDPREQEFAEQVLNYINEKLTRPYKVEDLAQHFHVSVRTLQRRIKAGAGASPMELVVAARLRQARTLIQSGKYRVSEAAFAVGFEDLSYFSRCYRRSFGLPPSQELE